MARWLDGAAAQRGGGLRSRSLILLAGGLALSACATSRPAVLPGVAINTGTVAEAPVAEPALATASLTAMPVVAGPALLPRVLAAPEDFQQVLWDNGIDLDVPQQGKFILVNIPGQELVAFEDGREVMRSRVVVGRPRTPTPVLWNYMTGIKLNPDWTPTPQMIRDEGARYTPPGPNNPLGRLKFNLDNRESIYLHDTNQKSLFEKDDRARSHGCVRVERYRELAAWVLGVDEEEITRMTRGGRTYTVPLYESVPVYLGYFTRFPNEYGQVVEYADIYGWGPTEPAYTTIAVERPAPTPVPVVAETNAG